MVIKTLMEVIEFHRIAFLQEYFKKHKQFNNFEASLMVIINLYVESVYMTIS